MVENNKIPVHVAFIMDGNGRWAKERLLPRKMGHREGVKAMKRMISECDAMGISYVTFYAFSTENWARPQEEIDELFALIKKFAEGELQEYSDKGYRIRILGDVTQLPEPTREALEKIVYTSKDNSGMCVSVAINYGGRQEIVNAVNYVIQSGITQIDVDSMSDCMYTYGIPDPDVIVRSGGEKRLSNFLIWQCAYSELIFLDKYWPDFDRSTLEEILAEYAKRDRRFGKIARLT